MTVEQLAEQYAENIELDTKWNNPRQVIEQAYIAGYNEAQNIITQCNRSALSGVKWHKVAEGDLPPNNWRGLIYTDTFKRTEVIIGSYRNDNGNEWYMNGYITTEPPITWAEIPTFTE